MSVFLQNRFHLRPPLWDSLNDARAQMLWGLSQADVVKIADNEIEFLTDTSDYEKGARLLKERFSNLRLLNVTAGANGSYAFCGDKKVFVSSFLLGGTIETTGAGDTFCASVLNFVLENGLDRLKERQLREMLRFANAAAYLVTTKKGAIRSMPEKAEVLEILAHH